MLATCICLNGSLLDQLSCTIVYLHNLFTCTFGRINMSVCLSKNLVPEYVLVIISSQCDNVLEGYILMMKLLISV